MGYYEMGGACLSIDGSKYFKRKIFVKKDDIGKIKSEFNNKDIYCTAFEYDNEDQDNSNLIGPLYLDLDYDIHDEMGFNKVKRDVNFALTILETQFKIPRKMIRTYFSGNKGFHIIVPEIIMGITPDKELNIHYKAIADYIKKNTLFKTIDTRIYDNKRLLRLANSINCKTGLYKVPISYNQLKAFNYEEIKEYASKPRMVFFDKPIKVSAAENAYKEFIDKLSNKVTIERERDRNLHAMPPCMKSVEENGADKGSRNNTAVILANCYYQLGLGYEDTLKKMLEWNEKNNPKLSKGEITSVTNSGYREGERKRRYGCSSIKDLGLCSNEKCFIRNRGM